MLMFIINWFPNSVVLTDLCVHISKVCCTDGCCQWRVQIIEQVELGFSLCAAVWSIIQTEQHLSVLNIHLHSTVWCLQHGIF